VAIKDIFLLAHSKGVEILKAIYLKKSLSGPNYIDLKSTFEADVNNLTNIFKDCNDFYQLRMMTGQIYISDTIHNTNSEINYIIR